MPDIRPVPFGPTYQERLRRCHGDLGEEACCVCGKPTKGKATYATVLDGGSRFATATEEVDTSDPGYMGGYPVGTTCAKRLKKAGLAVED